MSLAQRSIRSSAFTMTASGIQTIIGFMRSILLARLLPVETFGVYAWATSIVALSSVIANFGLGGAFLHRTTETEDEEQTSAIHFTLSQIFSIIWVTIFGTWGLLFTEGETRLALLVLIVVNFGIGLFQTPQLILIRRVSHRRLALFNVLNNLLSAFVAIFLALRGVTIWALLSTDLITLGVGFLMFYIWKPVWKPRFVWSSKIVKYFLQFGGKNLIAQALHKALNEVDDLWTGFFLGDTAIGLYSKAYTFATYPRQVLAMPLNAVAGGTYAELKGKPKRLSQAFFRTNAFLVRSGFLLAGVMFLVAPEFIHLVLTDKWMPMLSTFRLMLIFTLLDPIKVTISNIFIAVGKPEIIVRARIIQLIVLLIGLFTLGTFWSINGVALAVDLMIISGIVILLNQARTFVSFSLKTLFLVPIGAVFLGMATAFYFDFFVFMNVNDWISASVKIVVFSTLYALVLFSFERRYLVETFLLFRKAFWNREES